MRASTATFPLAVYLALAAPFASLGVGCGKSVPLPTNVGVAALAPSTPLPTSALPSRKDSSPPGLDAHPLVGVPDGSIGPFLARRGDIVMGVYIGASSEGARRVVAVPLSGHGDARSEARVVAPVPTDATMLVVRPTGGPKAGFVAAWTSLTDRGEALAVAGITDDGRGRGDPTELARTSDDIVWIEVVPTSRGAVAIWAEQARGADASLLAAALGPDGAMRGLPARVARGVKGWQVVPLPDGIGLALVTRAPATTPAPSEKPERRATRGTGGTKRTSASEKSDRSEKRDVDEKSVSTILWQRLDLDARATTPPVVVASGARLAGEVDAVRAGDQALFAWTDASQPDERPVIASVDPAGHVRGPNRAFEGGAGGALVGLTAGPAGIAIAWEEPFRRGRATKRVTLARVDPGAIATDAAASISLDLQGRGAPEISGLADGFALLAPARVCAMDSPCEEAPVLPTFVRLDAKLAPVQVEPLRLGILRDVASAGWGLACDNGKTCLALAAAPAAEDRSLRVLAVDLASRPNAFRAPTPLPPTRGAPSVEAIETIASGEPFADLASARFGAGSIVALLASSHDETAKRDDNATILVEAFDGAARIAQPMTKRALPVGGVAIATTGNIEDGAAVAWVARDAGDPQVHVTRVDRAGKVTHDVQVTNARGDATDVAIAWAGDKWIVAWVDTRDGNGEVYAATLDRDGRRVGKGERITNAPGDATDVTLLALPDAVGPDGRGAIWLAWADPRESPRDGFADIYVAPLRSQDASRAGDEVRVLATAAHSRSPSLGARGKEMAISWIEEAPMGADPNHARTYGAMLAWLGANGAPAGEPTRLPLAGDGFPTSVALEGSANELHAVLARAAADMIVLDGVDLLAGQPVTSYPLVTLDGPPSLDVALGLNGDALYFNDESAEADARRVRRATIHWKP
jgi:hypothetical protein